MSIKIKGKPLEEVETEELERIQEELGEMLDKGEGTDGDAFAYVEITTELQRRKEQQ